MLPITTPTPIFNNETTRFTEMKYWHVDNMEHLFIHKIKYKFIEERDGRDRTYGQPMAKIRKTDGNFLQEY